jgi:hypothetical protein
MEEEDVMRWGVIRSGSGVGREFAFLCVSDGRPGVDDGGHEKRDHVGGREGREREMMLFIGT